MLLIEGFSVWGIWSLQFIFHELVFVVELGDFRLVILLEESLAVELFSCLGEVRLEERVYLGLGFHLLVIGEIVCCGELTGMELG